MHWDIKEHRFDNNLKLVYVQTPADDVSIIVNVRAGSLYETDDTAGISHLIEHMFFKGTEKRPRVEDISDEVVLLGKYVNATTSQDYVSVEAKVVLEDFEKSLDFIGDILYCSVFDKKELEKEKQIVLDEIRIRKDDPETALGDIFDEVLYSGTVLARPIIGDENLVSELSSSTILDFYKTHFTPSNTTLFIAGPKNLEEVVDKVEKSFIKVAEKSFPRYLLGVKLPKNKHRELLFEKAFENTHFLIGRMLNLQQPSDSYSLEILASLLANRVVNRIREKEPLAYYSEINYTKESFSDALEIWGSCDPSKYNRTKECILEEYNRIAQGDFSDKEVRDVIKSRSNKFILNNCTTFTKVTTLHDFWVTGRVFSLPNHLDSLKALTPDKVRKSAKQYFKSDDLTMVYLSKPPKRFWFF